MTISEQLARFGNLMLGQPADFHLYDDVLDDVSASESHKTWRAHADDEANELI